MPSKLPKRPSSIMPGSPLSPKMESMAIPSQARRRPTAHNRQASSANSAPFRLPSLPRFHPANFPSQSSSTANTPVTNPNSPQPPVSPRSQQKQYSEAQKQLYLYQRELVANNPKTSRPRPTSPRLLPTGSPGPVTPLELEGQDGYLMAGVSTNDAASHVDKLIREEATRRGELSPSRSTPVGGR